MMKTIFARLFSPLPLREGLGVGLLLLMGSASLQAQGTDPFPDVNTVSGNYSANMTIIAKVVKNGEAVTDATIAAYCGEEFRGKDIVGVDVNHPEHAYLTVYGDYEYNKYLLFKVYTEGHVFTCNPNPAVQYIPENTIGTISNPYIIDITPVSLVNNADNSSVLTTYNNETCDVVLTGRTLYKDGDWNTLCLPFNLGNPEAEGGHYFDGTLLEGATVKTLESTDFKDGLLTMNFVDVHEIEAGKPYLVKWEDDGSNNLVDPVFEGVTITNDANHIETDYVDFVGTYSSVVFDAGTAHKDVLFLGSGSSLYYPDGTKPTTINACRAYFTLKGITAGDPANGGNVKGFVLNFDGEDDPNGLNEELRMKNEEFATAKGWYSLDGKKLDGKPTQRGIYIHNGKKVLH